MSKTLQSNLKWGFISICFLKLWGFVRNGSQKSTQVGDILKSHKDEVRKLQEALEVEEVLNREQCRNLVNQLGHVVHLVEEMTKEVSQCEVVLEELGRISRKIRVLVQDCMKAEWCHAVVYQVNNREAFRELVDDLKHIHDAILDIYPNLPHIDFNAASYDEIENDEKAMIERLEKGLKTMSKDSNDYELANHLLRRLRFYLGEVKGGEMNVLEVPNDVKKPILSSEQRGRGASGTVCKSSWLGLESATKMLKWLPDFRKESCILACLSHPNITKFICCGRFSGENVDDMIGENPYYVVMELMEMSLSDWLRKQKRPLRYFVSINIMHEIARGMCYLHDMHVAHLDLKPKNVLLSSVSKLARDEKSIGNDFVKLVDYGDSKMEVPSKPEPQKFTIGTGNYMAPEMYNKDKVNVACPFEADVWSFAMTCSEILSLKEPFSGMTNIKSIMQKTKDGMRPELPMNCEDLTTLIEECWVEDPSLRPTFSSICERLAALKKKFIIGTYRDDKPEFGKDTSASTRTQLKAGASKKEDDQRAQNGVVVGLESNLSKVKDQLRQTNVLGLIGMGGIGKTTLAKATFHDMKTLYDASCFIENLKSRSSLEILCEILQNLGKAKDGGWRLEDAQKRLEDLLLAKKVLIILDDPKDEPQVVEIIPTGGKFVNNGTKIIITTRDWDIIKNHVEENGKIDVGKLSIIASKELISSYVSSNGPQLSSHLCSLLDKVVEACDGLPLSLKVMGAFLQGKKRIRIWERALERMKRGRLLDGDEGLWSSLRVSFDGLEPDEKNTFLDIACLIPRYWLKEQAMHILSNYGTSRIHVLDILMNKSLVSTNEEGFLEMHDQLRDMGRMIVETDEDYLGTRIWRKNMIPSEKRAANEKGGKKVEGIYWDEFSFGLSLENCKGFNDLDLTSLRLLTYESFKTLPKALENWASLTTLILSPSSRLRTLPEGLGNFTSLRTLILECYQSSTTLPEGLGNLTSLTTLDLGWCQNLRTLPEGLGNLTSLTTLNLDSCESLTTLPEGLGNLTSLITLDLHECGSLRTLPEGLGNLTSLITLDLHECGSLRTLPEGLENLTCLTTLNLHRCYNLTTLPKGLRNLTSLTTLDLGCCETLTTLPEGLGNLTSLRTLDLRRCESLTTIPEGLGNLTSLTTLNLRSCKSLTAIPEGLGNLISLRTLDLRSCKSLTTLPEGLRNFTSFTTLDLHDCKSLTRLPEGLGNLTSLTTLNLRSCKSLTAIPEGLGNLISLRTLDLRSCKSLTTLPEGLRNFTSFTTLDLHDCKSLTRLPEGLGNLTSLTSLDLHGCGSLTTLPEGLGNLTSLTNLDLACCESLTTIPEGLGNLTSLTTLDLYSCKSLTTIPEGLGNLTSLRTLTLRSCKSLTTIPEGLGNLI